MIDPDGIRIELLETRLDARRRAAVALSPHDAQGDADMAEDGESRVRIRRRARDRSRDRRGVPRRGLPRRDRRQGLRRGQAVASRLDPQGERALAVALDVTESALRRTRDRSDERQLRRPRRAHQRRRHRQPRAVREHLGRVVVGPARRASRRHLPLLPRRLSGTGSRRRRAAIVSISSIAATVGHPEAALLQRGQERHREPHPRARRRVGRRRHPGQRRGARLHDD